ncbi:MAG TPA: dihydropteroate synthase, partial [Hyphomonas sp.]|nr:dihydropteroate synthase [Hyphomonas sp.]
DSVYRGATILRVHDVAAHREALDMFQAIGSAN